MKKLMVFCFQLAICFYASEVLAKTTGMPWESPMDKILTAISGPWAKMVGAIAIIGFGVGLAFSEGGGMIKKALWIVMGLAIAANATVWGVKLMGLGGGVSI